MLYDFHAEAAARFAADTTTLVAVQTPDTLKAEAIGELLIDGQQTHQFLRRGVCHEIDPQVRLYAHSLQGQILATAALSYLIVKLPATGVSRTLLQAFVVGETNNLIHNTQVGCS